MKKFYKHKDTGEITRYPQATKVMTKAEQKLRAQKKRYPSVYAGRWPNE